MESFKEFIGESKMELDNFQQTLANHDINSKVKGNVVQVTADDLAEAKKLAKLNGLKGVTVKSGLDI